MKITVLLWYIFRGFAPVDVNKDERKMGQGERQVACGGERQVKFILTY